MKKLTWLLIPVMGLFFACQKDIESAKDENSTEMLKYGVDPDGVKKPHKISFYAVADPSQGYLQCTPVEFGDVKIATHYNVGGHGTHLGEIQMMKSTLIFTYCQFGPMPGELTTIGHGVITADNGDELNYSTVVTTQASDFSFIGTVLINGGTGRFMGCTGEMLNMTGTQDPINGTAQWTAEGWIIFKKK